jgi:hypothetical protein
MNDTATRISAGFIRAEIRHRNGALRRTLSMQWNKLL